METTNIEKPIDIEKVIESKSKKLKRLLPRFILSYLKRILHEDEVNAALIKYKDKYGVDFCDAILQEFGANIMVENLENLPKDNRYIVVSNHPLGGLDAMALMSVIGRVRRDFKFIVNDILLFLRNLEPVFIPVNKHGSNPKAYAELLDKTFSTEGLILMFPAGLVSRKQKGGIMDLEWKKSFVTKAKQYHLPVIPVFIDGKNSNFFYNLARFRKKIGIKANLEMLYLVDEMFKQKNKNVTIHFGSPIAWETFDKSKNDVAWAEFVKQKVYQLKPPTK